jgi:hypothetical protein
MIGFRYATVRPLDQAGIVSAPTPLHRQLLESRGIENPTRAECSDAAAEVASMLDFVKRRIEFVMFPPHPLDIHGLQRLVALYRKPDARRQRRWRTHLHLESVSATTAEKMAGNDPGQLQRLSPTGIWT